MSSTSSTQTPTKTGRGLVATGAIAGAIAGVVNLIVFFIGKAAGVSFQAKMGGATAQDIPFVMPFVASVVALLLGAVLLKYLARSARGITIWTAIAAVVFVAYTAGAFGAAATTGTALTLTLMHVIVIAAAFVLVVPAARRAL